MSRVFGNFCNEQTIKNFMLEADIDGDGKISFPEFKQVMLGFKKTTEKFKYSWSL